ncbi:MAG: hypothetical protein ABIO67_07565 [Mycobacteriales bacterium]
MAQVHVTVDCAESERLARFWCEMLAYVIPPLPPGFATWEEFDRSLSPVMQDIVGNDF